MKLVISHYFIDYSLFDYFIMSIICECCIFEKNICELKNIEYWESYDESIKDNPFDWCIGCSKYVNCCNYHCDSEDCTNSMCEDCGPKIGCNECKHIYQRDKIKPCERFKCDKYVCIKCCTTPLCEWRNKAWRICICKQYNLYCCSEKCYWIVEGERKCKRFPSGIKSEKYNR